MSGRTCRAKAPAGNGRTWACTRPAGHAGTHWAQGVGGGVMHSWARRAKETHRCLCEVADGNRDDPSYAYCGLPAGHAGEHGDWQI